MASNMKATIGIDGASKFRSEMRNMKASLKELDSEMKLADSQFRATGNAEQYMSDKSNILHRQLEQQNQVVKLLEERLKVATQEYGANSEEVSKLKTELNKAKTSQNDLKSAIAETEDPLKNAGQDTNTLATNAGTAAENTEKLDTNLQEVVKHLDLQAVANFADKVSGAIESAAKKAKDLAVQVWNLGTEAGSTADEWLTMSDTYNIPVEDIQKWQYAGRFIDTTLENITGSMIKFRTKFSDTREAFDELTALQGLRANTKGKKELEAIDKRIDSIQAKALSLKNNFGLDIYDAQNNLKNTTDLYWEMIDVIGTAYQTGNQELAEQAAMEWFGRSAANLNPLFKAGKQAFMDLGKEAEEMGYIMSEQDVQALGAFDDQTQKLQASIDALKLNMANELLPLLQPIADGFLSISDSMLEFIKSEEGQQAMSSMASSVGTVFSTISEDIPGAIQTVTGMISEFAQGFTDAESAVQNVITAIQTLAAVWAASKLVSFGANMINATSVIGKTIKGWFGAGTASDTASTVVPTATGDASKGLLNKVFTSTAAKVAGGTAAFFTTLFGTVLGQISEGNKRESEMEASGRDAEILARAQELGQTLEEAKSIISGNMFEWDQSAEEAIDDYINGWDPMRNAVLWEPDEEEMEAPKQLAYATDVYADALKRLDYAMSEFENGNGIDALRDSVDELKDADIENIFTPDVIEGMMNFDDIPAEQFASWVQSLRDQLAVAAGEAGENAGNSLAEGLSGAADTVTAAGQTIGNAGNTGIASGASPLQAFSNGLNVARGFANGIRAGSGLVASASKALASIPNTQTRATMLIGSPSKVMEQLGAFTAQGFANGIDSGSTSINSAVNRMLGFANASPVYGSASMVGSESGANSIISALNGAVVVMDGEKVGQLVFPYVNREMGETVARRYAS